MSRLGEPAASYRKNATTLKSLYAFIRRLIKGTVEDCLYGVAGGYTVTELIRNRTRVRAQLEQHVREALRPCGLKADHTTLHDLVPNDIHLKAARQQARLGTATLERQIELLGGDVVARQLLLRELARVQVPHLVGTAGPSSAPYHSPMTVAWTLAERSTRNNAQAGHPYRLIKRRG